jgi:hypothetical protein
MEFDGGGIVQKIRNLVVFLFVVMMLFGYSYDIQAETLLDGAKTKVEQALKEKTFYSFNMAYADIMNLPESTERNSLLARLAVIGNDVWTPQVTRAVGLLDKVCSEKDGKTYSEAEAYLRNLSTSEMDIWTQGYLLGQLTSWGKQLVYTEDYIKAVDSLSVAWTNKDQASYDAAFEIISNIKNQASRDYLINELAPLKSKITVLDPVQLLKEIREDNNLTREGRVAKLIELGRKNTGLDIPSEIFEDPAIYLIADMLPSPYWRITSESKLSDMQEYIYSAIATGEAVKLNYYFGHKDRVIQSNNSGSDINITDLALSTSSPLLKDTKIEVISDGYTYRESNVFKPNQCTYVINGQIYLKDGKVTTTGNWDYIGLKVSYRTGASGTNLILIVK